MHDIELEHDVSDGRALISVSGPVDHYTVPDFRKLLLQLDEDGVADLVIDLRLIEFLDSTGLGLLVGAMKRARARGGDIALVVTDENVLRLLRQTGLVKVFTVAGKLADVLPAGATGRPA
jgi:anti-sigma B factor antagonist